jgi:hypothetical protein
MFLSEQYWAWPWDAATTIRLDTLLKTVLMLVAAAGMTAPRRPR